MKTKLIILGCGNSTGVPRIDGYWGKCKKKNKKNIRTRCSIAIIRGSNTILIDTSPDIRNQFVDNNIKSISSVLFTHEHADQTNGLFELRPFYWKTNKKINIYGNKDTIKKLKKRFDYCFKESGYYPAIVKPNIISNKFSLGTNFESIDFKTTEVKHGTTKSVAYIFKKVAYISDCNDLSIIKNKLFKNLNILVLDCLSLYKNWAHFSLEESLYVHKMLKPKKTILTNLRADLDYENFSRKLPKNVIPAYDGLNINI